MIKHIKPLPVSEEMLGAYLEGNLSPNDVRYVELLMNDNDEFSLFIDELAVSENLTLDYSTEETPNFENDFLLPEIQMEVGTSMDTHILPFGFEPSFVDVAACAMMPDITDDGEIIINDNMPNTDIDNIQDIGIDVNSEDLPIDGE